MKIKILIADDHHVVRKGLVFFLQTQPDLEIVGEASQRRGSFKVSDIPTAHTLF